MIANDNGRAKKSGKSSSHIVEAVMYIVTKEHHGALSMILKNIFGKSNDDTIQDCFPNVNTQKVRFYQCSGMVMSHERGEKLFL